MRIALPVILAVVAFAVPALALEGTYVERTGRGGRFSAKLVQGVRPGEFHVSLSMGSRTCVGELSGTGRLETIVCASWCQRMSQENAS